jgi:proton-dependent oligopeptide transporter, POT family
MTLALLFKQPRAVFLLAFVQLWNRFSHYGMRALLVLYMVKMQHIDDATALGIYAVYCALVELGGVFGAFVAERMLGLKRAVIVGGWLIGIGHLLLALEFNFLTALGFVILGSSLYTTNIATLLGDFYPAQDERREQGFTLFYMSINVGALAATILCGWAAETLGWHVGFGLAALGMVISNLTLLCFSKELQGKGELPKRKISSVFHMPLLALGLGIGILALHTQQMTAACLPWLTGALLLFILGKLALQRRKEIPALKTLTLAVAGLAVFFAAEEQLGSSILLFADRMANASFSAMTLLAINPLVIIAGGPLAALLLTKMKRPALRTTTPFVLAGAAFATLALGAYVFPEVRSFPMWIIGGVIAMISFAELLVGPSTYSQCSEAALLYQTPQVMALLPIGFSMAASLGGIASKGIAGHYGIGFGLLAAGLVLGGGIFSFLQQQSLEAKRDQEIN